MVSRRTLAALVFSIIVLADSGCCCCKKHYRNGGCCQPACSTSCCESSCYKPIIEGPLTPVPAVYGAMPTAARAQ